MRIFRLALIVAVTSVILADVAAAADKTSFVAKKGNKPSTFGVSKRHPKFFNPFGAIPRSRLQVTRLGTPTLNLSGLNSIGLDRSLSTGSVGSIGPVVGAKAPVVASSAPVVTTTAPVVSASAPLVSNGATSFVSEAAAVGGSSVSAAPVVPVRPPYRPPVRSPFRPPPRPPF